MFLAGFLYLGARFSRRVGHVPRVFCYWGCGVGFLYPEGVILIRGFDFGRLCGLVGFIVPGLVMLRSWGAFS